MPLVIITDPANLVPISRVLLGEKREKPLTLAEIAAVNQVMEELTWKLATEER